MTGYEKTGYEIAAQVLGMKVSELRAIAPVDGGAVVTTHDGQRHGINDAGEIVPLAGAFDLPEPVLHQSGSAPQLVASELIPGTTTTANDLGEGGVLVPNEHQLVAGLSLEAHFVAVVDHHAPPVPVPAQGRPQVAARDQSVFRIDDDAHDLDSFVLGRATRRVIRWARATI